MQDTNGEHLRQLTHRNGLYGPLNWSPDGRHLAFLFFPNDADLALSLYIMKPDGADFQLLGKNVSSVISWSPDSQIIAFVS